jgi:dTDP-4-dehydrorhamnose 3,5-epimerase
MAVVTESDTIAGVSIVEPDRHGDERGLFVETYRRSWFPQGREMIQANRADRQAGSVVVLHDLRVGSPTDAATLVLDLGGTDRASHDHRGVFIPPGVAHGFAALSDMTITYLVDGYYNPADELGVLWNDPAVTADWGVVDPILSKRDQTNPLRAELEPALRPHFGLRV